MKGPGYKLRGSWLAGLLVAFGLVWAVGYPLLIVLAEALGLPGNASLRHFAPDPAQAHHQKRAPLKRDRLAAGPVAIP